jgi:hypothetical protein
MIPMITSSRDGVSSATLLRLERNNERNSFGTGKSFVFLTYLHCTAIVQYLLMVFGDV